MPVRLPNRKRNRKRPQKYVSKVEVKKMILSNLETKVFDVAVLSASIPSGGFIFDLSYMKLGVDPTERVGNQVQIHGIEWKNLLVRQDAFNSWRTVIFQWKEDTKTSLPSYSEILKSSTSGVYQPYQPYNFENLNANKFTVMYDSLHTVDQVNRDTYPDNGKRRYLRPKKVVFTDNDTQDGIGKLYALMVSDSTVLPHPYVNGHFRIFYKDA